MRQIRDEWIGIDILEMKLVQCGPATRSVNPYDIVEVERVNNVFDNEETVDLHSAFTAKDEVTFIVSALKAFLLS